MVVPNVLAILGALLVGLAMVNGVPKESGWEVLAAFVGGVLIGGALMLDAILWAINIHNKKEKKKRDATSGAGEGGDQPTRDADQ